MGSWNGGDYSPAPADGRLAVSSAAGSAWLRSTQPFAQQTLADGATFGNGPWQHVGWGADGFGEAGRS
jgi:hypothetical protein